MTLTLPFLTNHLLATTAARLGKLPGPDAAETVPLEVRANMNPSPLVLKKRRTDVTRQDFVIAANDRRVPVRTYSEASTTGRAIVYIHGGGFMVGGLDACDHICADIAAETGDFLISVGYGLAPDHPYPNGLDDCEAALDWMLAHAEERGVDPARIVVGGDSAGGNLTAALTLRARTRAAAVISRQILIYPMLDLTCSRESWVSEATAYMSGDLARTAIGKYYLGSVSPEEPCASPLFADDLSGLPPALVIASEHDTLRDDARHYAARLEAADVPVTFVEYPGMPHGFLSFPRLTRNYGQLIAEFCRFVQAG